MTESSLIRRVASKLLRRAPAPPSPYATWLLDSFHQFIVHEYGAAAMPRDAFVELFWRHRRSGIIRQANRYVGDLWDLFAPGYHARLPEYYHQQELQLTMTLLGYASDASLDRHYLEPYRVLRRRFDRAAVLEIGPGIPHGVMATTFEHGSAWCESLTIVEIDAVYTRFVKWWCERQGIAFHHLPAVAGQAPAIATGRRFEFVFAKDVFEHLDHPAATIAEVLRVAADHAILALDLGDRDKIEYQHISPSLSALAATVVQHGFTAAGETGNLTMFTR